jgi:hypothetical protein
MPKDLNRIELVRLDRVFIGTHSAKSTMREQWHEAGHWYDGFQFLIDRLTDVDGSLAHSDGLGFRITGNGQPAQNTFVDLDFIDSVMNGKRNVALLVGQKLFLFRLIKVPGYRWLDNRLSIKSNITYDSHRIQGQTEFSRWRKCYERHLVKNVRIQGGRLMYDKLTKSSGLIIGAPLSEDKATSGGGIITN